jgi:outer membrane lipoprotein carrier protein
LRGQGAEVALARLEILDAFGQRSVLQFERFEVNPSSVTAAQFQFTPPAGVQVIRP